MPLTDKGRKIMRGLREQYGKDEGRTVFYKMRSAGKITGVDNAMDALDSIFARVSNRGIGSAPAASTRRLKLAAGMDAIDRLVADYGTPGIKPGVHRGATVYANRYGAKPETVMSVQHPMVHTYEGNSYHHTKVTPNRPEGTSPTARSRYSTSDDRPLDRIADIMELGYLNGCANCDAFVSHMRDCNANGIEPGEAIKQFTMGATRDARRRRFLQTMRDELTNGTPPSNAITRALGTSK